MISATLPLMWINEYRDGKRHKKYATKYLLQAPLHLY